VFDSLYKFCGLGSFLCDSSNLNFVTADWEISNLITIATQNIITIATGNLGRILWKNHLGKWLFGEHHSVTRIDQNRGVLGCGKDIQV
jgi:hypothetical protein